MGGRHSASVMISRDGSAALPATVWTAHLIACDSVPATRLERQTSAAPGTEIRFVGVDVGGTCGASPSIGKQLESFRREWLLADFAKSAGVPVVEVVVQLFQRQSVSLAVVARQIGRSNLDEFEDRVR